MDKEITLEEFQVLVGAKMKAVREAAGLSPKQLTERTGLGKGQISSCEAGKRNLTLDIIRRYAQGCEVNPMVFLDLK